MDKPKEYQIKTVQDMLDCTNEDNLDNFIKDLKGVLASGHLLRTMLEKTEFEKVDIEEGFVWVDDNDHKITVNMWVDEGENKIETNITK